MINLIKFCSRCNIEMTLSYDVDSDMIIFKFVYRLRGDKCCIVVKENKENYDDVVLWNSVYQNIIVEQVIKEIFDITGINLTE